MEIQKGYSFNDLLLVPAFSTLASRSDASLETRLGPFELGIPILSSPMDTVTEIPMVNFMNSMGGTGIIHRYNAIEDQVQMVIDIKKWEDKTDIVGAAIGVNGDAKERASELIEAGVDFLVIDIAHGHMSSALDMCRWLRDNFEVPVMSGNIVTPTAAIEYIAAGAKMLRVGVGPGSACSTRLVAGVGYPQISAIFEIRKIVNEALFSGHAIDDDQYISIVSDGGIKHSGDVVKALAAGADAVILGGLLSGFTISAGETFTVDGKTVKNFRGMASDSALSARGTSGYLVEGESFLVEVRDDYAEWLTSFLDGIRGGMAYLGAENLGQLRKNAKFVEVSQSGFTEGTPHFSLKKG